MSRGGTKKFYILGERKEILLGGQTFDRIKN